VSVVCCQVERPLRRDDHSSRGVLPSAVCLNVISGPQKRGLDPLGPSSHEKVINVFSTLRIN